MKKIFLIAVLSLTLVACSPGGKDSSIFSNDVPLVSTVTFKEIREFDTHDEIDSGSSTPEDGDMVEAYRQAGATWWVELIDWTRGSYDEAIPRVAAGPPR